MTAHSSPRRHRTPMKTLLALALGCTLSFSAPVFADALPEAQKLVKQGQFAQALEKVESHLATQPKDAQGRFLKGLILTEMNKPNEAIALFNKLTEDYPELPEPYNNLAVLYAQQKQYDKARTALEMAIRTHPSYAIAYENLGDVYAKLASQAYDKALQLDSANTGAQNKLSLIRDLIGNTYNKPSAKPASTPSPAATRPAPKEPAPAKTAPADVSATIAAPTVPAPAAPVALTPEQTEVAQAISAWANAWETKDMTAYLAAYASDFNTPRGMTREAWENERIQRVAGKSGKISVRFEPPVITVQGDKASARFRQHYAAPGLKNTSQKTLNFVRVGNRWLIQDEISR